MHDGKKFNLLVASLKLILFHCVVGLSKCCALVMIGIEFILGIGKLEKFEYIWFVFARGVTVRSAP